jgi:small-conductance mechanosensitive channel
MGLLPEKSAIAEMLSDYAAMRGQARVCRSGASEIPPEEAARQCEALLSRLAPVIRLADASSLPYRYLLWVHHDGYMSSFAGREELLSNIHRSFSEAGIQVTTEAQDVRVERKRSASHL